MGVGIGDGDGAVVVGDDVVDDGESEARAAGVSGSGGVESYEAFEDALPVGRGDARSIVGDGQTDGACCRLERDVDVAGGVFLGVVDQVADHPPELEVVAVNEGWGVEPTCGYFDVLASDCLHCIDNYDGEIDRGMRSGEFVVDAGEDE